MKWHDDICHMSEMVNRHRRMMRKSWLRLQWQTKEQYLGFMPNILMEVSVQCWVITENTNKVLGIIKKINGGFYSIKDNSIDVRVLINICSFSLPNSFQRDIIKLGKIGEEYWRFWCESIKATSELKSNRLAKTLVCLICSCLYTIIHFKYFWRMGTYEIKQYGCCHISYDKIWSSILILTEFLIGCYRPMLNRKKKKTKPPAAN